MSVTVGTLFFIFLSLIMIVLILIKPYIGLVLTLASLPVIELIPTLPFLFSFVVIIGGVTLFSYIYNVLKSHKYQKLKLNFVHVLSLCFVIWLFITNPEAAWFGEKRNWFLTFFQCWVLLFLASKLVNTYKKNKVLIWVFSTTTLISALYAITEGTIGESISTSIRAEGLAGQSNLSARYFVIAMLFFSYLASTAKSKFPRTISFMGIAISLISVFYTLSRTGILLLFIAFGLQMFASWRKENKWIFIIIYLISLGSIFVLSEDIFRIIKLIFPSIVQGTDTVGTRYEFWRAGLRMWWDNPFFGVGIGNYPNFLSYYAPLLPMKYLSSQSHNTYINVLSETGIIGFFFFMGTIFYAFKNYVSVKRNSPKGFDSLRRVWLQVFIIILIGGITMGGQYDKLLWFTFGQSALFFEINKTEIRRKV